MKRGNLFFSLFGFRVGNENAGVFWLVVIAESSSWWVSWLAFFLRFVIVIVMDLIIVYCHCRTSPLSLSSASRKPTGLMRTPDTLPMFACVVIMTFLFLCCFVYCLKVWDVCMFEGLDRLHVLFSCCVALFVFSFQVWNVLGVG